MNLNIFKHAIFSIMGFIILLCLLAYGTEALFGTNATYLRVETYTTSYGATFDKYSFDITAYTTNLQKDWFGPIKTALNIGNLRESLSRIGWVRFGDDDNIWERVWKGIQNLFKIFQSLGNIIAFIINVIVIIPLQFLITILIYVFTTIGIDLDNFWLGQGLVWINQNLWIPYATY